MKKILYLTTTMLLLLIGAVSCDNNDDESKWIDIPREPQNNEIKVIFNTTSENSEALFYISGDGVIDWGDGQKSTTRDVDKTKAIRHQYEKNKEYIITITARGSLETFRNFSANDLSDFKEEKICFYEDIKIGSAIEIDNLYIQTSGVKKISVKNGLSVRETNLLLGSADWNLPMINSKFLSIYMADNHDLDIMNLVTQHLSIIIKDEVNNLSITSCENLETAAISTKVFTKATINNLSITSLPLLNDLRLYSLTGKNTILTDLPQLRLTLLNMIDYETIDFTNNIKSSTKMSLKAEGLSVSKSIKLSKQLATIDINNRQFETLGGISKIDFSVCPDLESINMNSIKDLRSLEFGVDNLNLNNVILKNVVNLNSLDFSLCENIKSVEVTYATSLSNAKFSSKNKFLQDVKFQDSNFTESSCVDLINTLPNFPIPNIPEVNRRRLSIRKNNPNLKDNDEVVNAVKNLRPYWNSYID